MDLVAHIVMGPWIMAQSGLKAKFARLRPTQAIVLAPSGSRERITIQPAADPNAIDTIAAILLLRRCGLTMLRSKRVIEAALANGRVVVDLPHVAAMAVFERMLRESGFVATAQSRDVPDSHALRERFGLTQEQFAARFGLEIDAVRNWEHGRRAPDTAARSLLRVIARCPKEVEDALAIEVAQDK